MLWKYAPNHFSRTVRSVRVNYKLIHVFLFFLHADKCFGPYQGGCFDLNRACETTRALTRDCSIECLEGYYQLQGRDTCTGEHFCKFEGSFTNSLNKMEMMHICEEFGCSYNIISDDKLYHALVRTCHISNIQSFIE